MNHTTFFTTGIISLCAGIWLAPLSTAAQIVVGAGSSLTIGEGASVSVIGGDITVEDGAELHNQGFLSTDGDVLIQGVLRTTLRDTVAGRGYGQIRAGGQAIIDGDLQVAEAPRADFRGTVDFPIIVHGLDRAGVFWDEALPRSAYSVLYEPGAVIAHLGEGQVQVASAKTTATAAPLTLFPNPAWGQEVYVRGISADREMRDVYVRNVTGQRFSTNTEQVGDNLKVSVSAGLAAGMYLLELIGEDGVRETLPFVLGRE